MLDADHLRPSLRASTLCTACCKVGDGRHRTFDILIITAIGPLFILACAIYFIVNATRTSTRWKPPC